MCCKTPVKALREKLRIIWNELGKFNNLYYLISNKYLWCCLFYKTIRKFDLLSVNLTAKMKFLTPWAMKKNLIYTKITLA